MRTNLFSVTVPLLATTSPVVTFTTNPTIAAGDTTYDGQDVIVSGCTLTVNGPFTNTPAVGNQFFRLYKP